MTPVVLYILSIQAIYDLCQVERYVCLVRSIANIHNLLKCIKNRVAKLLFNLQKILHHSSEFAKFAKFLCFVC